MLFHGHELANLVPDASSDLREHVERVCEQLPELTGEVQILPVTQMRDSIKQVRERLHEGGITLIADRGEVGDANETTVMISLQTFNQLIVEAIGKSVEIQAMNERPADIITGLPRLVEADADVRVAFDTMAQLPSAQTAGFIKL